MPLSSDIRPEPNPPLDRARVIRAREMYAEGFTVSRVPELAPVERERDVRMLMSLTRALRDLQAMRKHSAAARAPAFVDDEDEDMLPADIDAIYRELAHRMEAMAAGGAADVVSDAVNGRVPGLPDRT
jgi:hypothetical protein